MLSRFSLTLPTPEVPTGLILVTVARDHVYVAPEVKLEGL